MICVRRSGGRYVSLSVRATPMCLQLVGALVILFILCVFLSLFVPDVRSLSYCNRSVRSKRCMAQSGWFLA